MTHRLLRWLTFVLVASKGMVGLHEAALWRTGPLGDPAPATDVAYDFLGLLMDELANLGLDTRSR